MHINSVLILLVDTLLHTIFAYLNVCSLLAIREAGFVLKVPKPLDILGRIILHYCIKTTVNKLKKVEVCFKTPKHSSLEINSIIAPCSTLAHSFVEFFPYFLQNPGMTVLQYFSITAPRLLRCREQSTICIRFGDTSSHKWIKSKP